MTKATAMPTNAASTKPNKISTAVAWVATASAARFSISAATMADGAGSTKVGTLNSRIAASQIASVPTVSASGGRIVEKPAIASPNQERPGSAVSFGSSSVELIGPVPWYDGFQSAGRAALPRRA